MKNFLIANILNLNAENTARLIFPRLEIGTERETRGKINGFRIIRQRELRWKQHTNFGLKRTRVSSSFTKLHVEVIRYLLEQLGCTSYTATSSQVSLIVLVFIVMLPLLVSTSSLQAAVRCVYFTNTW